jgi:hypothetical protein
MVAFDGSTWKYECWLDLLACVHLMSFLVPMTLNVPNASFDGWLCWHENFSVDWFCWHVSIWWPFLLLNGLAFLEMQCPFWFLILLICLMVAFHSSLPILAFVELRELECCCLLVFQVRCNKCLAFVCIDDFHPTWVALISNIKRSEFWLQMIKFLLNEVEGTFWRLKFVKI